MVFNSFEYLVFFIAFFAIYWLTSGRLRLTVCLAASYVFYGWWDYRFCALLLWSTFVDYAIGIALSRTENSARRRTLLIASLVSNLVVLGFFKYFNFFADSLQTLLEGIGLSADWPTLNIILPVGISFYTFQTLSYSIDVFRGKLEPEKSLLRFATFVAFFPQLVAGPIVRASEFLPQLQRDQKFDWTGFQSGLGQVLLGLVKKVVVADSAASIVDNVFAAPEIHSPLNVAIGIALYAFQIYGDFSGYSDIAIGTARMLGFEFPVNFRFPYLATSLSDFWSRWHVSLSSWLRDYLYIPLGGNRGGKWFTYRNLMLTMLLGGLWHGANWTFVCWGALHGFYLIGQRELGRFASFAWIERSIFLRAVGHVFSVVFVFLLVCMTWILFRSSTFAGAMEVCGRLVDFDGPDVPLLRNRIPLAKACLLAGCLYLFEIMHQFVDLVRLVNTSGFARLLAYASLVWVLLLFGTFGGKAFIYFQF